VAPSVTAHLQRRPTETVPGDVHFDAGTRPSTQPFGSDGSMVSRRNETFPS
jgi:hypothetical protein